MVIRLFGVYIELEDGTNCSTSVPSGASIGKNEAIELRDGDKGRYLVKGDLKAMDNVPCLQRVSL